MFTSAFFKLLWEHKRVVGDLIVALLVIAVLAWIRHHFVQEGYDAGVAAKQAEVNKIAEEFKNFKQAQKDTVDQYKAEADAARQAASTLLNSMLQNRDASTASALKGVRDEISKNAVYRDCRITDAGMRAYAEAGSSSGAETGFAGVNGYSMSVRTGNAAGQPNGVHFGRSYPEQKSEQQVR